MNNIIQRTIPEEVMKLRNMIVEGVISGHIAYDCKDVVYAGEWRILIEHKAGKDNSVMYLVRCIHEDDIPSNAYYKISEQEYKDKIHHRP